jgi:hypothetical protein
LSDGIEKPELELLVSQVYRDHQRLDDFVAALFV